MSLAMRAGLGLARQAMLLAGIAIAVFLLIRIVPGDVVDSMALEGSLDEEAIAQLRADLGLDAGTLTQFGIWAGRVLQGDFGNSLRFDMPVADLILAAVPTTIGLATLALAFGMALGIGLATAAVLWPRSVLPALVEALNLWSIALPTFCLGLGSILLFSVGLGWLPVIEQWLSPVAILGLDIAGQVAKPLHEDLKEAATAAHIRTARAKGLSPARIVLRHLLPNALTTVVALGGLILAGMIGGALTMEVLFGLPGLGTLAFQAVSGRDYPVIQAVVLVFAAGVVLVNWLADLAQRALDPRLRR
ncbi:ABC transporter permease [Roseomonas frigidaquae]|uniref:ABC transporter permease n=1 Tax=Falsiroseomonas frigidaquae TaxID=487318 RepID=A0ABX1ETA0_9PROT|nr:ABC transporter permease [Falsiroseomonas frigidaquae]NKE43856.1 ABC transporter permease [Falsiroseomonas frigidaquae]